MVALTIRISKERIGLILKGIRFKESSVQCLFNPKQERVDGSDQYLANLNVRNRISCSDVTSLQISSLETTIGESKKIKWKRCGLRVFGWVIIIFQ